MGFVQGREGEQDHRRSDHQQSDSQRVVVRQGGHNRPSCPLTGRRVGDRQGESGSGSQPQRFVDRQTVFAGAGFPEIQAGQFFGVALSGLQRVANLLEVLDPVLQGSFVTAVFGRVRDKITEDQTVGGERDEPVEPGGGDQCQPEGQRDFAGWLGGKTGHGWGVLCRPVARSIRSCLRRWRCCRAIPRYAATGCICRCGRCGWPIQSLSLIHI